MLYVLDTDHISLLEFGHAIIANHIAVVPVSQLATTAITLAEQMQGRLARLNAAKSESQFRLALQNIQVTVLRFSRLNILPYDENAEAIYLNLKPLRSKVGTQDLRIVSICLSKNATLVTRNYRHFGLVPQLLVEDWSH